MLGVVDHEQVATAAQVAGELLGSGDGARYFGDPECPRDRRQDESGVGERCQSDEEDAVGELVEQLGGDVGCKPGLPVLPGPVSVTSRVSGRERSVATSRISRSRPTSGEA